MRILLAHSDLFNELSDITEKFVIPNCTGLPIVDVIKINFPKQDKEVIFKTPDFNRLSGLQTKQVADQMRKMHTDDIFMYIEQDCLLLEPDMEYWRKTLGSKDIICAWDNMSGPCQGFFIAKVSDRLIKAFDNVVSLVDDEHNNQEVFAEGCAPFNIDIGVYGREVFNYGWVNGGALWTGHEFELPENLKVFHANFTVGLENKKRLLEYVLTKISK